MKLEIKPSIKINEGAHRGVIKGILYRTQPFNYTDLVIEFKEDEKEFNIKAGFPTMITPDSKLGKLLTAFGAVLQVGCEIDPADILVNRNVSFVTIDKKNENGIFANVVTDSVKPA